jgi:hypothetical protein
LENGHGLVTGGSAAAYEKPGRGETVILFCLLKQNGRAVGENDARSRRVRVRRRLPGKVFAECVDATHFERVIVGRRIWFRLGVARCVRAKKSGHGRFVY